MVGTKLVVFDYLLTLLIDKVVDISVSEEEFCHAVVAEWSRGAFILRGMG